MVDFYINNQGTIFLIQPLTENANNFLDTHFPKHTGDHLYLNDALVVESRYIDGIIELLNDNDLVIPE